MVPAATSMVPATHSWPCGRMSRPAGRSTAACSTRPATKPSSRRSTADAPDGTGAPVAMRRAAPAASLPGSLPTLMLSESSAHGPGPATAQPSMAEVSKAGRSVSVVSGAARA